MKELLIVFFILTVIVMAMAFPFKTRMMAHVNFLNTKGFYSLKVMKIKLLTGRFFLDDEDGFQVENSVDMLSKNYNNPFIREMIKEFSKRVDVKKVEMFFTGGFENDSYMSAIMCGMISSFIQTVYSYLYDKYEGVKLYEDVDVTFDKTNLEFTFDIVISISLFSILRSIIKADKQSKKQGENNEGN